MMNQNYLNRLRNQMKILLTFKKMILPLLCNIKIFLKELYQLEEIQKIMHEDDYNNYNLNR